VRTEAEIGASRKWRLPHDFIMASLSVMTRPSASNRHAIVRRPRRARLARALVKIADHAARRATGAGIRNGKQVQEAIAHLCQNRTTIVIAHRLHTIMHSDAILVVGRTIRRARAPRRSVAHRRSLGSFFRLQQREPPP